MKLMKYINDKISDSTNRVVTFCGSLVGVLTVIPPLLVGVGAIYDQISGGAGSGITVGSVIVSKNLIISILAMSVLALFFVNRDLRKRRKEDKEEREEIIVEMVEAVQCKERERKTISLHLYKALHDYRNTIHEIECYYKRDELTTQLLELMTRHFLDGVLNGFSSILSELTGYKVCTCIKVIVGPGFESISYRDAKVETFMRSGNSDIERNSMDNVPDSAVLISENTDFMEIVSDDRSTNSTAFYKGNLRKYDEELRKVGKKYKNTNEYWEKFYIGTIVVPIRIANKRLFYTPDDDSFNILGFLCADSLSEHAFIEEQKQNYVYITKAYAALIYNILSKYQYHLKLFSEEDKGDNRSHVKYAVVEKSQDRQTVQSINSRNTRKKQDKRRKNHR